MKKIFFALMLSVLLISLINSVSATLITISTNADYSNNYPHDVDSVSGVLFLPAINQTLVNITKNPIDTAPFCLVFDEITNQAIVNTTWTNNFCNANVPLMGGRLYRIGTGANGNTYRVTYDQSFTQASYPGIGDFTGGCYGTNCQTYTIGSTMYSIESITLSSEPPVSPPILTPIGPQSINENQTLTIDLEATDPNLNDTLVFLTNAQTVLPSNSFLNSNTGEFVWTPSFSEQGIYNVNFYVTDGQFIDYETVTIQVVDVSFATIRVAGNPTIGNNLILNLRDPQSANKPYILSASFGSSPGIPLPDGRRIPLNNDWLFNSVLYLPSLFGFTGSAGTLDSQGNGQVVWAIPNLPFFQNNQVYFSFVTLNQSATGLNVIHSVAPETEVTIQ